MAGTESLPLQWRWPSCLARRASMPRTFGHRAHPDDKPNLNGVWQALSSAHHDIEGHAARMGPIVELGALGSIPAGLGIVEGGKIPYQDWARTKQQENLAEWWKLDPAVKCFMPGIPRANYMPFPLSDRPESRLRTHRL